MSKRVSKFLLTILLLLIVIISSFSICFATDNEISNTATTDENETATEEAASSETSNEETNSDEIYSGDLYLFDNKIVMDKLVDGNVFVFGNDVEITGQVNGNLYVFANKLSFNESYIRYSIYACANSIDYNGACNDLYVATNHLNMTYDSYVVRDVKAVASDVIFKAAIGRDVDLKCNTVQFGENEDNAIIYGNLRYTSSSEATIPEGLIKGDGSVSFTPLSQKNQDTKTSVIDTIINLLTCIITVLAIYGLAKVFAPNFINKLSNNKLSAIDVLKAFGIGILTVMIFIVLLIILSFIAIGWKLAFLLVSLFIALCIISTPILAIIVANRLKSVLKIEQTSIVLALVSIVIYGILLIPYAGPILAIIIYFISIGMMVNILIPKRELTDEEKKAIEEAKKQAKEIKEKRKQEKLQAKKEKKNNL